MTMAPTDRVRGAWHEAVLHTDFSVWHDFYQDAYLRVADLAHAFAQPTDHVADLIAAISPLKAWPENLRLAREALLANWNGDFLLLRVPLMHARRVAAQDALAGLGPGGGRKVNAFAANLRGDLSQVTVDRHMLTLCGFTVKDQGKTAWRQCVDAVKTVAAEFGEYPANLQATVWGMERHRKGHATVGGAGQTT